MHAFVHLQFLPSITLALTQTLTNTGYIKQRGVHCALSLVSFSPLSSQKLTAFKSGMDVTIACTL